MSFTNECPVYASDLQDEFILQSDSQDVQAVWENLGYNPSEYDGIGSVFVLIGDGEILEVWGCTLQFPLVDSRVYKLFPMEVAEPNEFPTYVGSDGQEHGEY